MTQVASVRTISPGVSFVDELARGLLAEAAGDPFQLADTLVLLPNRRSCRALREAFLRVGGGQPMLLPSMPGWTWGRMPKGWSQTRMGRWTPSPRSPILGSMPVNRSLPIPTPFPSIFENDQQNFGH